MALRSAAGFRGELRGETRRGAGVAATAAALSGEGEGGEGGAAAADTPRGSLSASWRTLTGSPRPAAPPARLALRRRSSRSTAAHSPRSMVLARPPDRARDQPRRRRGEWASSAQLGSPSDGHAAESRRERRARALREQARSQAAWWGEREEEGKRRRRWRQPRAALVGEKHDG